MKIQTSISSLTNVLAAGLLFLFSGSAFAHGFTITAEAVCDEGAGVIINYTAVSRSTALEGSHPRIDILFNGIKVAEHQFVMPTNTFSGSAAGPAGSSATVMGVAVGNWADGAEGGQTDAVDVVYPTDCSGESPGTGRFTGGGHQLRVGLARVTRGLTIHCDLLLSNNLEVNWGGDKFHMTEHLVTVACTDDPDIDQFPPAAPLDTLIGVGTGRYNGTDGFTIEFTLVDYGEPGSSDQMAILIYETANPANVVLNIPLQLMSGGNLQAHFDQPHR